MGHGFNCSVHQTDPPFFTAKSPLFTFTTFYTSCFVIISLFVAAVSGWKNIMVHFCNTELVRCCVFMLLAKPHLSALSVFSVKHIERQLWYKDIYYSLYPRVFKLMNICRNSVKNGLSSVYYVSTRNAEFQKNACMQICKARITYFCIESCLNFQRWALRLLTGKLHHIRF